MVERHDDLSVLLTGNNKIIVAFFKVYRKMKSIITKLLLKH